MGQLSFELIPQEPYSLRYFVPHRGVAEAYRVLEQAVTDVVEDQARFRMVYLCGPSGTGKRHLMEGFISLAVSRGVPSASVYRVSTDQAGLFDSDKKVGDFVARFERFRTEGGLMIVISEQEPAKVSANPHVLSRLSWGTISRLAYPSEEELEPLLYSLLERRNLRLSAKSLQYLLRRLPRHPLSFDDIFGRISRLSFLQGKPAGFAVVREVLRIDEQ